MNDIMAAALKQATDTKHLHIGRGVLDMAPEMFTAAFGKRQALLVADKNTYAAAGRKVEQALASKVPCLPAFIYDEDSLHAEYSRMELLESHLESCGDAIPVAVGSGTLNDLAKLASHKSGRRYMIVATAASMDGYAAFGASITLKGSKQTFSCPAPLAILADLDVIGKAPKGMNSSGYADLIAKIPAGADWILADALGVEPIQQDSWDMVQKPLRRWLSTAPGVGSGEPEAVQSLMEGLILSGFAMQASRSSRPASGADHQFSHLWDMLDHTHNGVTPSHGHKVGIGAQASTALYEFFLQNGMGNIDSEACIKSWRPPQETEADIRALYTVAEVADKAVEETAAKWVGADGLRAQLETLKQVWPELKPRLREQLLTLSEMRTLLELSGAPVHPSEIGVSIEMLRSAYLQSYHIRRRFTVLDLAVRTCKFDQALETIFGQNGAWPMTNSETETSESGLLNATD